MKGMFICSLTVSLLCSCSRQAELDKIRWIEGNWENISDSSQFHEKWKRVNDSLFKGEAFVIESGETVFSEKISIVKREEDIFYVAEVPDQNQGAPVPFKLVSASGNEFVFENDQHDFPDKIIYTKVSADSIVARIEGKREGRDHSELFPFTRKKTE